MLKKVTVNLTITVTTTISITTRAQDLGLSLQKGVKLGSLNPGLQGCDHDCHRTHLLPLLIAIASYVKNTNGSSVD